MTHTRMRKKLLNYPENIINYNSDKWSIKSISLTPVESDKKRSRKLIKHKHGYHKFSRSKTPLKEKLFSESSKLPYI